MIPKIKENPYTDTRVVEEDGWGLEKNVGKQNMYLFNNKFMNEWKKKRKIQISEAESLKDAYNWIIIFFFISLFTVCI